MAAQSAGRFVKPAARYGVRHQNCRCEVRSTSLQHDCPMLPIGQLGILPLYRKLAPHQPPERAKVQRVASPAFSLRPERHAPELPGRLPIAKPCGQFGIVKDAAAFQALQDQVCPPFDPVRNQVHLAAGAALAQRIGDAARDVLAMADQ